MVIFRFKYSILGLWDTILGKVDMSGKPVYTS